MWQKDCANGQEAEADEAPSWVLIMEELFVPDPFAQRGEAIRALAVEVDKVHDKSTREIMRAAMSQLVMSMGVTVRVIEGDKRVPFEKPEKK
jgi:hypothetical protein